MNILFFLKPKSEVAYVHDYGTLRQVLETMEYHKYASIPMLNKSGEYVGTITEGVMKSMDSLVKKEPGTSMRFSKPTVLFLLVANSTKKQKMLSIRL